MFQWEQKYTNPIYFNTSGTDIDVDKEGNVIVIGHGTSNSSNDIILLKYSPNGNLLWKSQVESSSASSTNNESIEIAIDNLNNIYVTGKTYSAPDYNQNILTVKFNSAGQKLWSAIYNGPGNSVDEPFDIATDANNNVYVTGGSMGNGTSFDYVTFKYTSTGLFQWIQRYNGSGNNFDRATALVVKNNFVTVTGLSYGSTTTNLDYITIRYKLDGSLVWVNRFDSGNGNNQASDLIVDNFNNVFVTGYNLNSAQTNFSLITTHINPNGQTISFQEKFGCYGISMAMDSEGGVYVTGATNPQQNSNLDFITVKYDFVDAFNGGVVLANQMLWFKNQQVLSDVAQAMLNYSDAQLDKFEKNLNFYSLRSLINDQTKALIDAGTFNPSTNNPDNHFMPDDILRTLLNPGMEIRINNSIFKYLDDTKLIEIRNANIEVLDRLRQGDLTVLTHPDVIIRSINPNLKIASCSAFFTSSITPGDNLEYTFTDESLGDHTIVEWDFGDGFTTVTLPGQSATHKYSSNGIYTVTMKISGGIVCFFNPSTYSTTHNLGVCNANFDTQINGFEVTFNNLSTVSSQAGATVYWDFGDGGGSSEWSPKHKYISPGTYTVTLYLSDPVNCLSEKVMTVTIEEIECCLMWDVTKAKNVEYIVSGKRYAYTAKMYQINTVPVFQLMGGKLKTFVFKKGKWRDYKEKGLYIRIYGSTWKVKNPLNVVCGDQENWDRDKEVKNKRVCKLRIYQGNYFATKQNSLTGYFGVDTDGNGKDNEVTILTLTDCKHGK